MLLYVRWRTLKCQSLDVGCDHHGLDVDQIDLVGLTPVDELIDDRRVRFARVPVEDVRREDFPERRAVFRDTPTIAGAVWRTQQ